MSDQLVIFCNELQFKLRACSFGAWFVFKINRNMFRIFEGQLLFVLVMLEGIYLSHLLQSNWCCGQHLLNFSWQVGNFIRGIWFKHCLELNRFRIFITHQLFHWNKTRNCRRNIHSIKAATVNWHIIILLLVVSAHRWNPNCANGTEFMSTLLSTTGSDTLVGHKWEVWLLLHKGNYCEAHFFFFFPFFPRISNFLPKTQKKKAIWDQL